MWSAVVLAAGCLLAVTSGSKIILSANPDVLTTNLTQSITMRCSLNDTDVLPTPTAGGVVGKRDVTQTTENMQTLTSLVITRNNGDHVATLIQGQQPKALADLANMQVKGNLSGSGAPGEQGYLELTWLYPTTAQTGEYVCEVNTISSLGHNVIFSTTVEIGESVPTIGELMLYITALQRSTSATTSRLQQLANKKSHVQALLSQVCGKPHLQVQQGQVECGDSNTWTKDSHGPNGDWPAKSTTKHVTFSPPYSTVPRVEVGVVALDHDNDGNIRYEALVSNLDQHGFDVHCETWFDSRIYKMSVSWMSVRH